MDYNTTRKKLVMPEYGRLIQEMVDYTQTIEDRKQRQLHAEKIISVMKSLNPQMRNIPDYVQKLWNHLAAMSGYQLDIDYPVEIVRQEEAGTPRHLSYPGNKIKFRHYGHLIESIMEKLENMPDGPERDELILLAANRMKKNLAEWKGDGIENEKVARDLANYTHGQVAIEATTHIMEQADRQNASMGKGKRR